MAVLLTMQGADRVDEHELVWIWTRLVVRVD